MRLSTLDQAQYKPQTEVLSLAQYSDTDWKLQALDFSIESNHNKISTGQFMTRIDQKSNTLAVVATVISGTFDLAPDLYIYHTKKIIAGGIFSEEKDVVE